MIDKEKIIRQWEGIIDQIEQGNMRRPITTTLIYDTFDLLKKQEPVEPHAERDCDDGVWYYGCGACHGAIDYKDKFCRHCGREVKWDE